MILDSSFLIDLLRGAHPEAKKKAEALDRKFQIKAITSVTIMELWSGAMLSTHQEKEKKKVGEILDSLLVYNFTEREAKKAGEIEADLLKSGEKIGIEDIIIAATALIRNEKILTKNIKHFEKVKGLGVESY